MAHTTSQRIIACDANMEHRELQFEDWYTEVKAQVTALAGGVSTHLAKSADIKNVDRVVDHFVDGEGVAERIVRWRLLRSKTQSHTER